MPWRLRIRRESFCLTLALALAVAAGAKAEPCAPPRLENSVPMEPIADPKGGNDGKVAVPITINGVTKKFLFDTGGGLINYIKSDVALKLGMFRTDNFVAMDLNGDKSYRVAGARNVKFGAVTARDVTIFQLAPDLAFDGILSAGTMTGDDLDIDFGAMRLNFFSADHCPGGVVYWPHQALAVAPVDLAGGHFALATTLDGHALTAVIDTGSPWTILNLAWAKRNLGFSSEASQSSSGLKDQPDQQIYFRRYSTLSFPGITVANPLMVVRPLQFGDGHEASVPAPDMIIGMEVLRHLHLYYAARENKLYITPAASGDSPLPKTIAPAPDGHAWPENAQGYARVWDPIHRPH